MKRYRFLDCDSHGRAPWHGEVICVACGAVWKLEGNAHVPPAECGKNCTCGKSLVGDDGTARAICARCYERKRAQAAVVPS